MSRTKDPDLSEQRRLQILSAAAKVFKAKGFHAARTEDICTASALSPGTVFRHFSDKQAIIEAIAALEIARYEAQMSFIGSRDGMRWLATLTAARLRKLLAPSAMDLGADAWLELSRSQRGRAQIKRLHVSIRDALEASLVIGQKAGWVRESLHARGTATMLLALFSGLTFDAEMQLPMDYAGAAKALAHFFSGHILA